MQKVFSNHRAAELKHRLQSLCPMCCRPIRIAQTSFDLWTATDLDPLLEALAAKPAHDPDVLDERLPYWAELWPSARVLTEAILTRNPLPEGPWLELGCGPGLPGLAATHRGRSGIWTDYMPEALDLTEWNALTQGISNPQTRLLDWRSPPTDLKVPWILAADVAYEQRNFAPLLDCFDNLLLPGGEIWFSEPGRPVASGFFDALAKHGWQQQPLLQIDTVNVHRLFR